MIITIIISALLFIVGFVIGYLYKTVLEQRQKPIMPYAPIYQQQPPYISFDMPYQESYVEQLRADLRKVQLEISIHPLANLKYAKLNSKESVEIYGRLQKEYKELKLKELALIEEISKINKDNGVGK